MKMITNKKVLFSFLFLLATSFLFVPSKGYAQEKTDITIGNEISNTSLSDDYQYYKLTLDGQKKINFSVTAEAVAEQTTGESDGEEDYYDDYYDDESSSIKIEIIGNDYIGNWYINAGETKSKSYVLDAGTYTISIYGNSEGLKYTIKTTDESTYTKKISMVSKLSLLAGDSKTITVKSAESDKLVGEVKWTSSNEKVAKVDASGKVKAIKQGSCVISAKTKDADTVKCTVTVKARPQLEIKDASFGINVVDGVEPEITFRNNFGKTIKYVYFNTYYYNAVGDPAKCEIYNTNYERLKVTGPIKNGASESYEWDAVLYNSSTTKMYIKSAEVVFTDGSKKTVTIKKSYKEN